MALSLSLSEHDELTIGSANTILFNKPRQLNIETPAYLDSVLWKPWIFHIYISLPHSKWGYQR